ncbi:MAG: OmpA family protein, partial [Longimicrobiales bacterium]
HRADFAETSGDPSVWQSIKVRRTQRDGPGQMFGDGRVDRSSLLPGSEMPLDMFGLEEEPTLTSATSRLPSGSNESVFRWQSKEAGSGVNLQLVDGGVPADGQTTVPVRVSVRSQSGLPSGTDGEDAVVTLESTRGTWVSPDADPVAPGHQVRLSGGAAEAQLQTPIGSGPATVRASRVIPAEGGQVTEADVGTLNFTTRARSVLMTGLIEGRMDLRSLQQGRLLEGAQRDRFADALRSFAFGSDNGRWTGGLRASAFATGEVTDNTRVTLRLDSEVDPRSRLFNDIRPDELYTVYGDASPRIYEAQSKGRFYGLVERGSNYLQFGDFTTAGVGGRANVLGRYSRTLNGLMSHWEQGRGSVDAFVSRDRFRQVVDEIPARGISGPYSLSRVDGLFNSERVELVTRDRTQPAVILSVQPMQRFTDYTIEPLSGRIVFRRPVASLDAQLNPVTIRVSYELEQGGDAFMTYGLAGQFSATDRLALGASVIRDSNPLGSYGISSLNADFGLGTGTRLAAEVAVSDSADVTSGLAYRLMLQHVTQGFEVSGFIQDSDTTFLNRSAGVGIGRREVGITARRILDHRTQLFSEAVRTESRLTAGYVQGATLGMERRLSEFFSAEVGYRWANRSGAAPLSAPVATQLVDVSALRLRLTGRSPSREASLFTEYEQDLTDASLKRIEVGGDWRILDRARVYARHELMSSFAGPYALNDGERLNQTVFGISADYMAGAHVFSEYRARDAFDGRQAHAAMGLRNEWMLQPGLGIGASFERIDPLTESSSIQRSLALGGSVEYTANPLWRGTVRGEYRASAAEDQVFGTLGFARKLSRDWSLLGQSVWSHVLGGGTTFGRTRTGVAYRSTDTNRWNALARYEHRLDESGALSGTGDILGQRRRGAHVLSAHSSFSPTNSTVLALQAATKFANEDLNGITLAESAHLLSTRMTRDLVKGWDVGAMGRTLFNGDFSERQFGLGLEVGRVIRDNFRVAVGYNAFGFTDQDLTSDLPTDHGLYVDVGFAFDEGLFGFGRRTETPVEAGGGGGSDRRYEAPSPSTDALKDWSEASLELAGCTGSRCSEEPESATTLAEVENRTTDERIAGDLSALTALRIRLDALATPGDSTQLHNRVEARAMVDLAEVEYTDNDQTGVADAVRSRAEAAVLAAEGGVVTELAALPYEIRGAPTTRADFWDRIQDVRDSYGFKCAARPLAQSTVRLVWAGNEERTYGERIPSHEGRAEALLLEAEEAARRCLPEMIAEPDSPEFAVARFAWDGDEAFAGPALEPGPVGSTRLGLRRKEQGELVMVVRFDFGGDWLTEEARRYLDTAIRIYGSAEGLEVVGHTDAQGEEDFNMRLGRARAETVAQYLREAGAPADQIDISSMGETSPIEEGETEEAYAINRRVEIRVRQAPSE